ncbi:glucose-6-phosphatase a, catalytic subunit, tandem duplicate 1 [Danio aesculapii]|uniref:glucose-6-phosphatase a, catalytic subunit, tandem duplicate 1 n=1 Tax=Danio aesculapii TaxID=1142201 RepID=UPI0024C05548|nr:glucose-6-phosphatase a, catalytic subunit, tandem duplicate 1 [Danio aesculapii]XP_056326046.1 glucose-6-phosphatase a, catalytic subunit, tandem duplicate 1 [Danio aesculapii]
MDLLHSWGVELAVHLQIEYQDYESVFHWVSSLADLHTTFFVFFPIWFHLHRDVAVKLIWVAVVGDWLNLVLKWVLFGERPYWWVHETKFYGPIKHPELQQFSMTCETGPGSPSGHAMGSAAVGYVMVTALLSIVAERKTPPLCYKLVQLMLWVFLGLVELLVCMSRVYLAAHFPHQVICGVISGIIVAETFSRVQWIYSANLKKYFIITLFLLSFAVGFYVLLKALGVDLLWTLEKAQKWCINPAWVLMDTTPFASLLRNMGTLFGLGLGLYLSHYTLGRSKKHASICFRAGCIGVSLVLLQLLDKMAFSSSNQLFYLLSFCKSAVALLLSTALVPGAMYWLTQKSKHEKDM